MAKKDPGDGRKVVATNKRARLDYDVVETIECGMVLRGSEVKSLRAAQATIKDGFGLVRDGELWLENVHIAPYEFAREGGHDPERRRKLLAAKRDIERLDSKVREQGLTLVPIQIYFRRGMAKVELGLARGRRKYDKRRVIREREQQREMDRAVRRR